MVYFEKSQPAPPSLLLEKNKNSGTYRTAEVIARLDKDFYSKCYICGQKNPTTINVEHFMPHRGDRDLMFDWNNLFYDGEPTSLKALEEANLRDLLLKSIKEFQELLIDYYKYGKDATFLLKIKQHLNNSIELTAFKRYIIRHNETLKNEFEHYIID